MATEIVKVQVPFNVHRDGRGLVYAEGRDRVSEQLLSRATVAALGDDIKGYFEAEWHAVGWVWMIGVRVENRDW